MRIPVALNRLCIGGFLVLCGNLGAGVRFQEGMEAQGFAAAVNSGPVQVRLPVSGTGPKLMQLPAAVAVTPSFALTLPPVIPTNTASNSVVVSLTAAQQQKVHNQQNAERKAKTRQLALRICAENLALVRGLALVAYQSKQRADIMKIVLAAAMAERQVNRGVWPNVKGLKKAVADVPFYLTGLTDVRAASKSAYGACTAR
jgi:hypothetical protein